VSESSSGGKAVAMNVTSAHLQLVPNESVPFSTLISEENISDYEVKKVILLMKEDLAQTRCIKLLAQEVAMSPRQLERRFKFETGHSPMHYLHVLRFERACFLLGNSSKRIKEICHEVGIENVSNFDHEFKKWKGCTPRNYRQKMMGMKSRVVFYQ
jgi:transcriptional regulator GlxA family with amidase domain